jgi:uncharacterized protein (DUF4415 family)
MLLAEEISKRLERGESKTDWKRVKAMSQAEVERLADEDEGALPEGWENTVTVGLPPRKNGVHIRLDTDILDWFKAHDMGYQTRINAVLRSFVQAPTARKQRAQVNYKRCAPLGAQAFLRFGDN